MSQNTRKSRWEDLLLQAFKIIDHVNRKDELLTSWTFGGGTALMLQIDHRESHDVDLFLDDPQLLPYVTASVEQLNFDIGKPTYNGDGSGHLKISFEGIGEIDFIVTGHITDSYAQQIKLFDRTIELETVTEIIAKKVRFRGSSIQPRDIFDIAAACEAGYEAHIIEALVDIDDYRQVAAARLEKLNEEYVTSLIVQLMLKPKFEDTPRNAIIITRRLLNS